MRSLVLLATLLVAVSALSVVFLRHQHRLTYVALQQAEERRDQLNIEWGQWLLEQNTWSVHHRVESEAARQLGMVLPVPERIIVVGAGDEH